MKVSTKRIGSKKAAPSLGERVLARLRKAGIVRSRDLVRLGATRATLGRLVSHGLIERIGRGLYAMPGADLGEKQTLVEAVLRVRAGIVCLLSALQFHGLTTQNPAEVWLAIPNKARKPTPNGTPLRIARFSGRAYTSGIVEHHVHGATVRVYDPAKTVADCFKFRHAVGHDVALEALRECWRARKATMDQLWAAAKVDRVANLMRPYLEAIA